MSQETPSYAGNSNSVNSVSRDIGTELKVVPSLEPKTRTADASGGWVDLKGFEAAEVVFEFGVPGVTLSATDKIACKVEESDDALTSLGAVAAADLIGSLKSLTANSDGDKAYQVGYKGKHRYIRAIFDYSGTHGTGTPGSAIVVLGYPRRMKTAGVAAAEEVGS